MTDEEIKLRNRNLLAFVEQMLMQDDWDSAQLAIDKALYEEFCRGWDEMSKER